MSRYNKVERGIARVLSRVPYIKKVVKLMYARWVFLRSKKSYRVKSSSIPDALTVKDKSSFFGYYDKVPENELGMILLCVTSSNTRRLPSAEEEIQLVVLSEEYLVLLCVSVQAYNWQQGCRAHWLSNDLFIFNDFDKSRDCYISRVFSVSERKEVKRFDFPVQDSFSTEYFISLNYQRLRTLRPDYGYYNLPGLSQKQLEDLNSDGLWRVDYESGEGRLFISLKDVCSLEPAAEFSDAIHKINHVMISPDGSRFIFMHRYFVRGHRVDRLILADSETAELRLLSDHGMVSHCFWVDKNTILGYMRGPQRKDAYWLIDVGTGEFNRLINEELSSLGDGHPHVRGEWFVTDTYPDKARMQHLLLGNWKTGEVLKIGEFYHGFEFHGESRCDLHPRLSYDGRKVYFDSIFNGKRHLYAMRVRSEC